MAIVSALKESSCAAKEMLMQGSGHLDFGNQAGALKLRHRKQKPAEAARDFGDLIQGARNELLQINVRGTIQDPKVSASSLIRSPQRSMKFSVETAPEKPPKQKK